MAPPELMDEAEFEDIDLPGPDPLRIRVQRDGSFDVVLGAMPLDVASIDIDEASIERIRRMPTTVRDAT